MKIFRGLGKAAFSTAALIFALTVIFSANSFAATLTVDDDLQCAGSTFTTIQSAINAASPGDTIQVCSGTYNETQVLVNKSLNIIGAGADTTIINGGGNAPPSIGLVRIETPAGDTGNTMFSGFTIMNPGAVGGFRYGMFARTLDAASTATISNNRIVGVNASDYGFYSYRTRGPIVFQNNTINNTGFNPILLEQMLNSSDVSNNTISGTSTSGTAYFNFTYGGDNVTTLQRVANNTINASAGFSGINFSGSFQNFAGTGTFTNVQIANNVISQLQTNRNGISLINGDTDAGGADGVISNAVVTGNRISGTDASASRGISITGVVTGASITCNTVENVDRSISAQANGGGAPTGTVVNNNNFVSNVTGFFWNVMTTVNAENNYWGSQTGPIDDDNPSGTGDAIVEAVDNTVDYMPFLTAPESCAPVVYQFRFFENSSLLLPSSMYFTNATAGRDLSVSYSLSGYKGPNPYSQPPTSQQINCFNKTPIGASSPIQTYPGDPFYNSTYDIYTTIWRTQANYAGTCRRLTLYFNDGSTQTRDYRFN